MDNIFFSVPQTKTSSQNQTRPLGKIPDNTEKMQHGQCTIEGMGINKPGGSSQNEFVNLQAEEERCITPVTGCSHTSRVNHGVGGV